MEKIKVSVIIPCYNQEELVIKCIDSVPKRDDIEIIAINDGSTDDTYKSLLKCKEKYDKLQIISYKTNKGVSFARNQGLDVAKGEYVLMIDNDDYIDGVLFNKIVDNYLNYDMVFYDMINNNGNTYICLPNNYQCRFGMFKFIKRSFIGDTRFIVGMQYAEDKEFTLELLKKNPTFYCTGLVMYHYNFPRRGSLSFIGERRH